MTRSGRNHKILDSWKEIAVFLGRGVRTVQRWEAVEGLPVRRHQHAKGGTVYAHAAEVTAWMKARERTGRHQPAAANTHKHNGLDEQPWQRLHKLANRQAQLVRELHLLVTGRSAVLAAPRARKDSTI